VIFVALALYRLFKEVNGNLAVLVVILGGLLPAAIYFCNVLNDAAAVILVRGSDFLSVFEKPQRDALAMLFLSLHGQGFLAGEIFYRNTRIGFLPSPFPSSRERSLSCCGS
jgi:hypothetical protein